MGIPAKFLSCMVNTPVVSPNKFHGRVLSVEQWKKGPRVSLGYFSGTKSYPVMWGFFHKPWNKDQLDNQDSKERKGPRFFCSVGFLFEILWLRSTIMLHAKIREMCCMLVDVVVWSTLQCVLRKPERGGQWKQIAHHRICLLKCSWKSTILDDDKPLL